MCPAAVPEEGDRSRGERAFLTRIGERVREARARHALSRKRLADRARVSERYLAQLENGEGNVSMLLLRRIAAAIDLSLLELFAEETEGGQDIAQVVRLLRAASPAERRGACAALGANLFAPSRPRRHRRIALIGLRGAGKSTLGRRVAGDLGYPFVELNERISVACGLNLPEIFNLYGEEGYRRLERRCLQEVIDGADAVVLASAGGIVAEAATFELLLASFFTVWVRATPAEHMARVRAQGDMRPMAGNPQAMDELVQILEARAPLYARADRVLDTSGATVEAAHRALLELLQEAAFAPAGARG